MSRLDTERQKEVEPERMEYCENVLSEMGFSLSVFNNRIDFIYKDEKVMFYPYSGWHTGKSIKDGRGLQNLLNQLK